ncbi:hypothetical protein SAMD00019534_118460, partial [Acytostelium subglobosum LB1]|uniref:hypothetical protein n=1 Tax=Acytostelium subglobosum LB1 TaxID=1410327 RepID=UPI0006452106
QQLILIFIYYNNNKDMFLFDWIESLLNWLGFLNKEGTLMIIGLGNAGKQSHRQVLSKDVLRQHMPTLRPHSDSFNAGSINFKAWDLGGQQNLRFLWRDYSPAATNGKSIVIFMIDSTDQQLLAEAKSELYDAMEYTNNAPMLIVGSKIDREGMSRDQLIKALDLDTNTLGLGNERSPRILDVLMISSVSRKGIPEMMNWLIKCHGLIGN